MKKLLHIDTSIAGERSQTRVLTRHFLENWKKQNPEGLIISRDLAHHEIPHLNATTLAAFHSPEDERTDEMQAAADLSQTLIGELMAVDEIVIGVPMYNFGIPSSLKAYIDYIARAGITFQYTPEGPKGLVEGKTVTILTARGGFYAGTTMDHQAPYLETVFQFIGITDIRFIHAEGVAMKPEEAMTNAKVAVEQLLAA